MRRLTLQDYQEVANRLGCEVAAVQAVAHVESLGGGFLSDGSPKILFEGHVFWKQLKKRGINPHDHIAGNEDVLYTRWTKKHYVGGKEEYDRLEKAMRIYEDAAYASASYGEFQIMGFHWQAFGYEDAFTFVNSMRTARGQLDAFVRLIEVNGWAKYLRTLQWAEFAKRYNGPGYKRNNYDTRMASAYKRFNN